MSVSQQTDPGASSILGIDYDSEGIFGVVIGEDAGEWRGTIKAPLDCGPGDSFDRARRIRDLMPPRTAYADAGVVAIGVEDLRSRQRSQIAAASRVEGGLLQALPRDLEIVRLSVNRREVGWKALTVGKTNASKDEIKAWAIAEGAPAGLEQDFYDAFAIARATRETLSKRRRLAA
jgi:hypothetical protein